MSKRKVCSKVRCSLVHNITSKCIIDNVYSVSWKYVWKFNIHWTINMPTIINSDLSNWNCQYLLYFYFGIILVEIILRGTMNSRILYHTMQSMYPSRNETWVKNYYTNCSHIQSNMKRLSFQSSTFLQHLKSSTWAQSSRAHLHWKVRSNFYTKCSTFERIGQT